MQNETNSKPTSHFINSSIATVICCTVEAQSQQAKAISPVVQLYSDAAILFAKANFILYSVRCSRM